VFIEIPPGDPSQPSFHSTATRCARALGRFGCKPLAQTSARMPQPRGIQQRPESARFGRASLLERRSPLPPSRQSHRTRRHPGQHHTPHIGSPAAPPHFLQPQRPTRTGRDRPEWATPRAAPRLRTHGPVHQGPRRAVGGVFCLSPTYHTTRNKTIMQAPRRSHLPL
jgi:hypothetical protein